MASSGLLDNKIYNKLDINNLKVNNIQEYSEDIEKINVSNTILDSEIIELENTYKKMFLEKNEPKYYFIINAKNGIISKDMESEHWLLTVTNIDYVHVFTDRPFRITHKIDMDKFEDIWYGTKKDKTKSFDVMNPVTVLTATGFSPDIVILESIERYEYDINKATFIFYYDKNKINIPTDTQLEDITIITDSYSNSIDLFKITNEIHYSNDMYNEDLSHNTFSDTLYYQLLDAKYNITYSSKHIAYLKDRNLHLSIIKHHLHSELIIINDNITLHNDTTQNTKKAADYIQSILTVIFNLKKEEKLLKYNKIIQIFAFKQESIDKYNNLINANINNITDNEILLEKLINIQQNGQNMLIQRFNNAPK